MGRSARLAVGRSSRHFPECCRDTLLIAIRRTPLIRASAGRSDTRAEPMETSKKDKAKAKARANSRANKAKAKARRELKARDRQTEHAWQQLVRRRPSPAGARPKRRSSDSEGNTPRLPDSVAKRQSDYLGTKVFLPDSVADRQIQWEVLPPGWWRTGSKRAGRQGEDRRRSIPIDRLEFLDTLKPQAWYRGSHLHNRLYYVADFGKLAIAECPDFGNALYCAATEDWRTVFRMTKREALSAGARRVTHHGNWRSRIRALLLAHVAA